MHVYIQHLKETACYLSFEDDVECVCFCSFSNDDIFVLVLHLRGDLQKNKAIMTGDLKMYNMYTQILQMGEVVIKKCTYTVVGRENGSNTQSSHLHTSSIESMILDSWTSFRSFRVRDL